VLIWGAISKGLPVSTEVKRKDYRNVDAVNRVLCDCCNKRRATVFVNTAEPSKKTARLAARYLAKYLSKAQTSDFRLAKSVLRLSAYGGR
jgi:hypothetical protein